MIVLSFMKNQQKVATNLQHFSIIVASDVWDEENGNNFIIIIWQN
jgi:hypothetical protein